MIHNAIKELYPNVASIDIGANDNIKCWDINDNLISIDLNLVNTKTTELQTVEDAKEQAKIEAKASALAKLEALGLTQEEVKAIL